MEFSKWFSPKVRPTIIGVYQVDDDDNVTGDWYAYWNGRGFGYRCSDKDEADRCKNDQTHLPDRVKWRGLASDPSKDKS